MATATPKRSAPQKGTTRPQPPLYDYSDKVTEEHLARVDSLVDQKESEEMEVVSGPGW